MSQSPNPPALTEVLAATVAAVEAEGERLLAEFYRPEGPRGSSSKAPIDDEIEARLCEALQRAFPCTFLGEETGETRGSIEGWCWSVDPHDATSDFLKGYRGSSISVGLLRGAVPVLGVVHAPASPDCGSETFAWAEGAGRIRRNGAPIQPGLRRGLLEAGEFVFTTTTSMLRPLVFSRAVAPAGFVALASIAHRMARVAAGDGVATVSIHQVHEYDIAAGAALINAAGGVVLDATGREVVFTGKPGAIVNGCFAGAPEAALHLSRFDWNAVRSEAKRPARVTLGFPKITDARRLSRSQGCLMGFAVGAASGAASSPEVAQTAPQPIGNAELAIALSRSILSAGRYDAPSALAAYRAWLESQPPDVDPAVRAALSGTPDAADGSSAPLLRAAPLGVWAAGDPGRAAAAAREDCALTHTNPACIDGSAAIAAAIAAGVAGASREAMLQAALAHAAKTHAASPAHDAIERASNGEALRERAAGSALAALENAFRQLMHASAFEPALRAAGSPADAAIAGALLGAAQGIEAIPPSLVHPVLACRPLADTQAPRPRPMHYWPDDVLEIAEALLQGRPGKL